jgi:hypothetical protein
VLVKLQVRKCVTSIIRSTETVQVRETAEAMLVSHDIAARIRVVGFACVMSLSTAVFPRDGFRFLRKFVKVKLCS